MKPLAFLLTLLLQATAPVPASLVSARATLRQLADHFDEHRDTSGATADLTGAKHQLRDWVESQLAGEGAKVDTIAFMTRLHASVRDAGLLCDDCDFNYLGYVDDVRVDRAGNLLIVVIPTGIYCGYDESAYAYAWDGSRWQRVWEHEQNTYTKQDYLPQQVHDIQASSPDASGNRLLMLLGSATVCNGSFKNLYVRTWRLDPNGQSTRVLDWTERANDGYPPLFGRLLQNDVLFEFDGGGFIDGATHKAIRHFTFDQGTAKQVDPIAGRPLDFVDEWLAAPWEESRTRSESASLETSHAQLHRGDGAGDFPGATLRCTGGADLWQVETRLYERPKRFFRVRWRPPYSFTMVDISDTPFPDCTVPDSRGDVEPDLLHADLSR